MDVVLCEPRGVGGVAEGVAEGAASKQEAKEASRGGRRAGSSGCLGLRVELGGSGSEVGGRGWRGAEGETKEGVHRAPDRLMERIRLQRGQLAGQVNMAPDRPTSGKRGGRCQNTLTGAVKPAPAHLECVWVLLTTTQFATMQLLGSTYYLLAGLGVC